MVCFCLNAQSRSHLKISDIIKPRITVIGCFMATKNVAGWAISRLLPMLEGCTANTTQAQGAWRRYDHIYYTRDKFTMLRDVGMANKPTKTTQISVRMAQHNERTRLHDLSCIPTNLYACTSHATLFVHYVEPSAHLFVWFLSIC